VAAGVALVAALLVTGLCVYRDYGISWDEPTQREYGRKVYEYVLRGDDELLADRHRVYGPVFELLLYSVERALGIEDLRDVYLMRHLVTFVMFAVGVVFFYLLVARMFGTWKMGLVGTALLVVSPRIFAHAFYNSKDIPLMAMFIVCMYTLMLCLDGRSLRSSLAHGACCAVLVDMRLMGMLVPAVTAACLLYEMAAGRGAGGGRRGAALRLGVFCAALIPLTVLLWPTLWTDPVGNFMEAFQAMRRFAWRATVLFMGEEVWSTELPWYYTTMWILITLPVMYVVLALTGLMAAVRGLARRGARLGVRRREMLLVLTWLVVPLGFVAVSGAVVYDTWRHMFFVYPAIVLLALMGLAWVGAQRRRLGGLPGRLAALAPPVLLAANMCAAAAFMIRSHPHQNVFFNALVGGVGGAAGRYEMDYWGLSYRRLLESLLEKDGRSRIAVHSLNEPGYYNSFVLAPAERTRLVYVDNPSAADYYITNFRWERSTLPEAAECAAVVVDGVTLSAAYSLRRGGGASSSLAPRPKQYYD